MTTSHEIQTIEEFRGMTRQPTGVVVVRDTASETKAHRTTCRHVTETNFQTKVVDGRTKNGRYYFFLRFDDAERELGARWCRDCN